MANEAKFTPGPWGRNIAPATKYPTIYAGRNTHVAMVVSGKLPAEQVEANCNLIAAAPLLLEACRELLNTVHNLTAFDDDYNSVQIARAAIAAATTAPEPGCDYCRNPLFASLKCPGCGRTATNEGA